jgi:ArsR family metal-binding transcriptional regulator
MARKLTEKTIEKGKITLSIPNTQKTLLRRVKLQAEAEAKSVSEKIWELVNNALKKQERNEEPRLLGRKKLISTNLGRVKITDREELYDEILAYRL